MTADDVRHLEETLRHAQRRSLRRRGAAAGSERRSSSPFEPATKRISSGRTPLAAPARAAARNPPRSTSSERRTICMALGELRRRGRVGEAPPGDSRSERGGVDDGRPPVGRHDERPDRIERAHETREVVDAQRHVPARGQNALDDARADPRDAQQRLARRAVDVDRKEATVAQRPGELGIAVEVEHAVPVRVEDFLCVETVVAHQPVGLIEPVLAHQGRPAQGKVPRGVRDRAERGVIDALQPIGRVERGGTGDDVPVPGVVGADDHLGALAGRSEARGAARLPLLLDQLVEAKAKAAHRGADDACVLLGREAGERLVDRQLDVDRKAVRRAARPLHQVLRRAGDRLEMDVASKVVVAPKRFRHPHHLLHRVVLGLRDARRQKEPLDHVAAVEPEGERDDLLDLEPGARRVARDAIDAIGAVVDAKIREQDLEKRDAAPVRRVGVADPRAGRRAQALSVAGVPAAGAGGRAGRVVFRRVGEDRQFTVQVHRGLACDNVHVLFLARFPTRAKAGPAF